MQKQDLKFILLNSKCVIENEYLDLYLQLILDNQNRQFESYRTQCHHILPRGYFKLNNLEVDNESSNKVNLLYKDHILAHYYLALCATSEYKDSFSNAFAFLINRIDLIQDPRKFSCYIKDSINKDDLLNSLPHYQELYECAKQYQHKLNKGGKWMNNGLKQQYVRPCDIDNFLDLGYIVGKLPLTEAQKAARKTKTPANIGRITITNGSHNKFIYPEDLNDYLSQGWYIGSRTKGRKGKPLSKEQIENLILINKGKPAWNKGLTKDTDSRVLKYTSTESARHNQFQKGSTPWNKGKPWDEATKEKMRHPKTKKSI